MSGSGSQDGQVQAIKNSVGDDLLSSARETGVDVDSVIEEKLAKHGEYSADTVARFVKTDLQNQIEAEKAETLKGIIMGSRDRHGRNWPRRHSLIRSSGDHVEVSSWDGTLPTPDGTEAKIPPGGSIVNLRCAYDEEYESHEAKRLEKAKDLDLSETIENIGEVAVTPSQLTPADEYEVVAVKGTIEFVNPQTIFVDGEPDHDGDILMEDERGELQPHFEISLRRDGATQVRGHIERQGYGKPYYAVPDLTQLCRDAYEVHESPQEQANFIETGLKGMDVLIVGNVNNYAKQRNDDGEAREYVDIGVTALVELGADVVKPEPPVAEESDSEAVDIDDIKTDISAYADLTGTDVAELTPEDIVENTTIDAPESVVDHALRDLSGENEESGESLEGDTVESQFSELFEAGMYQCPKESCPGKGSSEADLVMHVQDVHDVESAGEAKEWLNERV